MQWTNQNSKQIHVTGVKRENACERGTTGFVSHWLRKWQESWSIVKQNQSKREINFDTQ